MSKKSFYFLLQAVSLASSPSCSVTVVGMTSGHVYYVDVTNVESPRIVHCEKIYNSPVKHLV